MMIGLFFIYLFNVNVSLFMFRHIKFILTFKLNSFIIIIKNKNGHFKTFPWIVTIELGETTNQFCIKRIDLWFFYLSFGRFINDYSTGFEQ